MCWERECPGNKFDGLLEIRTFFPMHYLLCVSDHYAYQKVLHVWSVEKLTDLFYFVSLEYSDKQTEDKLRVSAGRTEGIRQKHRQGTVCM